jgi:hypothetical protein
MRGIGLRRMSHERQRPCTGTILYLLYEWCISEPVKNNAGVFLPERI